MPERPLTAVLFDLDGTLIDSAPDLLHALDRVLARLGLPVSDHDRLRHHASRGAAGILAAGLPPGHDLGPDDLKDDFLALYAKNLWRRTRPFPGIDELLDVLAARNLRLGIVTNKISRFADPVLRHAGWEQRFGCVITGDRVAAPKPDPEPVLAACRALGVAPGETLFIGDDRRDVEAGRAAGTLTAVARWGYIEPGCDPASWRADLMLSTPEAALRQLIAKRPAAAS